MPKKHDYRQAAVPRRPTVQTVSPVLALSQTAPDARVQWPTLLTAAIAAAIVISTLWAVIATYTPLPQWDYWAEVIWLKSYYSGHWYWSDLWRQHNEHRILFPRLFFIADFLFFRGVNVFPTFCTLLVQAALAWIFIREIRLWPAASKDARNAASAIIVILFFSAVNLFNLAKPFQLQFVMVYWAAALAIRALIRHAEETGEQDRGRLSAKCLAASFAAGIVATFSLANGILVWGVLLLIGAALRLRPRVLISIAFMGALMAFLYFHNYQPVVGHTDLRTALSRPLDVIAYVAAYLTLPLARINRYVGIGAGVAVLVGLACETFRMLRGRPMPRMVLLSIGMMLFITGSAFLTALGRLTLGAAENVSRYGTPASIFWACALIALLNETRIVRCSREIWITGTLVAAMTCVVTVILPMHLSEIGTSLDGMQLFPDARLALLANVPADQLKTLFPDPMVPFRFADVLRTHRLSVFASPPAVVGEPLGAHHKVVPSDRCRGVWESTNGIGTAEAPGQEARGWAWDTSADRRPKLVVIADRDGVIRGLSRFTGITREQAAASPGKGAVQGSNWSGFAAAGPSGQPYRAYAVLSDGASVCPLSNAYEMRPATYAKPHPGGTENSGALLWQNAGTGQVTLNYYGGPRGATLMGSAPLNTAGTPGWRVVGAADFDGNGVPDLVTMNDTTRQVRVTFYSYVNGEPQSTGSAWLDSKGSPGWSIGAVEDVDGDGTPDLVWTNDTTRDVSVHFCGRANGGFVETRSSLLKLGIEAGWRLVGMADFDGNGVPDLVWMNDRTFHVTVNFLSMVHSEPRYTGWAPLNSGDARGWDVVGTADYDRNGVPDVVYMNAATHQVTVHFFSRTNGQLIDIGWAWLNSDGLPGWYPIVPH